MTRAAPPRRWPLVAAALGAVSLAAALFVVVSGRDDDADTGSPIVPVAIAVVDAGPLPPPDAGAVDVSPPPVADAGLVASPGDAGSAALPADAGTFADVDAGVAVDDNVVVDAGVAAAPTERRPDRPRDRVRKPKPRTSSLPPWPTSPSVFERTSYLKDHCGTLKCTKDILAKLLATPKNELEVKASICHQQCREAHAD